eukprot:4061486-Heterocapsa_arctica.AAC.1
MSVLPGWPRRTDMAASASCGLIPAHVGPLDERSDVASRAILHACLDVFLATAHPEQLVNFVGMYAAKRSRNPPTPNLEVLPDSRLFSVAALCTAEHSIEPNRLRETIVYSGDEAATMTAITEISPLRFPQE